MESSTFNLGASGSDQLIARRSQFEQPEFDITAMVDLVFMMNIYFIVTFVTIAMGQLNLPTARHVAPLDEDSAVILSVTPSLDGKSATLFLGAQPKGEPITGADQQEKRVQEAVEQGKAAGKTDVLLKAEKKVHLGDLFRIATAAASNGLKLHVAVLETDKR